MSELNICIYCKGVIQEAESYVVPNKQESTFPRDWYYAHATCHEREQTKATSTAA